jgi:hypothetical protein
MGTTTRRQTGDVFAGYNELEVTVCTCGVLFAVPEKLLDQRRYDGESFYCPHGHSLSFKGERTTQEAKLRRANERNAQLTAENDQLDASRRAYKGQATRLRKRAAGGVCPCCNRTFKELGRHMKDQHPDFVEAA